MIWSNNPSPSILMVDVSGSPESPTPPASGRQRLFTRVSDGHLCRIESDGTVTDIEGTAGDVVGPSSAVDSRIAVFDGTTGKLIKDGGSTIASITAGAISSSIYVNLQDQKAQNTQGGSFTSGAWRTRDLNTEVSDVGGLCSLASNQFTLSAGTYWIMASAPAYFVNNHKTRLFNVTDNVVVLPGTSEYASTLSPVGDGPQSRSLIEGLFTIGASKALEIQHQCTTTCNTNGFGNKTNFATEVYTTVSLLKIG